MTFVKQKPVHTINTAFSERALGTCYRSLNEVNTWDRCNRTYDGNVLSIRLRLIGRVGLLFGSGAARTTFARLVRGRSPELQCPKPLSNKDAYPSLRSVDEGRLRISACQLLKSFRRCGLSCTHRLIRAVNGQDQKMSARNA